MLRRIAAEGPEWYAALPEETPEEAALRHSLPDWIAELWFDAYGERAGAGAVRCRQPRRRRCRSGRIRCATASDAVAAWLREAGAAAVRDEATGVLRVDGPLDVAGSQAFAERRGRADRPRGRPGRRSASERSPGMRVLDLCAAPGGKTAVLAATGAAGDGGRRPSRRAPRRSQRRCAGWASTPRSSRPTAAPTRGGPFDRILVDAPCSGLGVLAGRPDARWRRTPEDADELATLQVELVRHARGLLTPAGELHFAVCTLNPGENEAIAPAAGLDAPTTSSAPGPTRATTASTPPASRAKAS